MSVIITNNIPESCVECYSLNCSLPYPKNSYKDKVKKKYITQRHEDCPLKSIDGLIEKINQIELLADKTRGDIKDEAIKIIKEYCEVE